MEFARAWCLYQGGQLLTLPYLFLRTYYSNLLIIATGWELKQNCVYPEIAIIQRENKRKLPASTEGFQEKREKVGIFLSCQYRVNFPELLLNRLRLGRVYCTDKTFFFQEMELILLSVNFCMVE